jgi:hypothetical protein
LQAIISIESATDISIESVTAETIKLICNVCSENPLLIDNITGSSTIIDSLFSLLQNESILPKNIEFIINAVHFFHSVSMKDGIVRNEKL